MRRSPLRFGQRLRCRRMVLGHWLGRYARIMAGECKNAVRRRLGLGRGRHAPPEAFVKSPVSVSEVGKTEPVGRRR